MSMIQQVSLDTNLLTAGAMLGTEGKIELIQEINNACGGGSYFGGEDDPYRTSYGHFMTQIVAPVRQNIETIRSVNEEAHMPDVMRPITTVAELKKGIPPCMYKPILTHPAIRQQLEEEVIDGFGIKPTELPDEDVYGRLANNGVASLNDLDENGGVWFVWEYHSDDPEFTDDELEAIRKTREFIDEFMIDEDTKFMDFTDYPSLHG